MDPVTHALAGCAIADAGFRGKLGPSAPAAAAVLAASPDIDVFFHFFPFLGSRSDGLPDLWFTHRAVTHSFPVQAVAAFPLALFAWRLAGRRGPYWAWALMAMLALFSHSLLDYTNSWGTRLWLPLSDAWSSLDALPIVDIWVTGSLALSCLLCRWGWRRASGAVLPPPGAGPVGDAAPKRGYRGILAAATASLALFIVTVHAVSETFAARGAADECRKTWAAEGFDAEAIRAMPVIYDGRLRTVVAVDAEGRTRIGYWNRARNAVVKQRTWEPVPDPDGLVRETLASVAGRETLARTGDMVRPELVTLEDGRKIVWLHDLRVNGLSDPDAAPWRSWRFEYDAHNELLSQGVFSRPRANWRGEWSAFRSMSS